MHTNSNQSRFPRATSRVMLGAVLTLTLAAPATIAHATTDITESQEVASAATTEEVSVETTTPAAEPTQAPAEAGAPVEPAPEPQPTPEPAPESAPPVEPVEAKESIPAPEQHAPESPTPAALAPAEDQPAQEPKEESAAEPKADDVATQPEEALAPTDNGEAWKSSSGGVSYLLPSNTARYVTFTVVDVAGEPVRGGSIRLTLANGQGIKDVLINGDGEATFMSVPYGTHEFFVSRNQNSRPDLQSLTGEVVVNELNEQLSVTLQPVPGASARGFHGRLTNRANDSCR